MPPWKAGRTGEHRPHTRHQRIHLLCTPSTIPRVSPVFLCTCIYTPVCTSIIDPLIRPCSRRSARQDGPTTALAPAPAASCHAASSPHPGAGGWHGILAPLLSPAHRYPPACPQGGGPGGPCPMSDALSPPVPRGKLRPTPGRAPAPIASNPPPLRQRFSSARGRKERCQNQPSSSCKYGKPHLIRLKLPQEPARPRGTECPRRAAAAGTAGGSGTARRRSPLRPAQRRPQAPKQ